MRLCVHAILAALLASCVAVAQPDSPRVFWASSPVEPGQVAMVLGHGFGEAPVVRCHRLPDDEAGSPFAPTETMTPDEGPTVQVLDHYPQCLKFIVPDSFAPGVFEYQIQGPQGFVAGTLNRPDVRWIQGDRGLRASPGGWLRAFGTNLMASPTAPRAVLAAAPGRQPAADLHTFTLEPRGGNRWALDFDLPADLAPGQYLLAVHNGQGGFRAWSDLVPLEVVAADPWPTQVFNVQDFGASGEGRPEDQDAIQAALAAADRNGGGVVYFPRGQYLVTETLRIPPRTVLRGERREWVSIFWPETDTPLPEQVRGTSHFALEDLTLYCSNYTHVIVGDLGRQAGGNIRLERLRVRANIFRGHLTLEQVAQRFAAFMKLSTGGGDTVRMGGPNIVIRDCDLYGAGRSIWLYQADGAVVAGNQIYQGRWGWYNFDGCDGLVFENNVVTGADLMSTGGGISCLGSPYSRNVYYAANTLRLMHGWDREAMTTDAGGGAYYGRIASCKGTTLQLQAPGDWGRGFIGAGVFILGGRGMGQFRRIVSYEGARVEVERPWDVEPDASSIITITMLHHNYLFIDNAFEDAGIGLQYYGTSIDCIAAGNRAVRAGGFYASGRHYYGYQPSWYCQFLGNEIQEGNGYRFGPDNIVDAGPSFIGAWGVQRSENPAPLSLCTVIRGNVLHNNARIDLRGYDRDRPGLLHAVVEGNTVRNSAAGIYVDPGCVGVLVRNNRFDNVATHLLDNETLARLRLERARSYIGKQEPIGHWAFEDDSADRFANVAGAGFAALAVGTVSVDQGVRGKALRLDGNGYLVIKGSEILNLDRYTLSAWIWPQDIRGRWGIVAKRTANTAAPAVLAIAGGCIEFDATDVDGQWSWNFLSPPVVTAARWQHVALVVDPQAGVTMYLDGHEVAHRPPASRPLGPNDERFTIGFEAWGGPQMSGQTPGHFVGLLDEVKLWGRPLSPDEVAADYRAVAGTR